MITRQPLVYQKRTTTGKFKWKSFYDAERWQQKLINFDVKRFELSTDCYFFPLSVKRFEWLLISVFVCHVETSNNLICAISPSMWCTSSSSSLRREKEADTECRTFSFDLSLSCRFFLISEHQRISPLRNWPLSRYGENSRNCVCFDLWTNDQVNVSFLRKWEWPIATWNHRYRRRNAMSKYKTNETVNVNHSFTLTPIWVTHKVFRKRTKCNW